MITIDDAKKQAEKFLTDTEDARELSQKCRDYFDGKQWTADEVAVLAKRKQAPITVNRVRPKVEGLVGLYNLRQSDPKAFPRTKKHENSAHAITDALRYVADNNDLEYLRLGVAGDFFVEGYAGAIVDTKQLKTGEVEVRVKQIPWDRIYFDPHSRRHDFADARFKGMIMWMDVDEAKEKFPKADIDSLAVNAIEYAGDTFEDRPKWVDRERKRVRVAYHYGIHKSVWHMGIFCGNEWLMKPQVSPFLNDDGDPDCPIELVSANIDRENNRYGEVAGFLDQQDEINHRRSKFLHYLNSRATWGNKGAIQDIPKFKREMQKPDGHAEAQGKYGEEWGFIETPNAEQGQFALYQDAKAELDSVSMNAQLSGERQNGEMSGVAIDKLQQAGTLELNRQYSMLAGWEKRIYRQIWGRVKQFWTEEKWIRVTDDQDALRWVGLNGSVTAREFLEDKINDESLPLFERRQAAASYQMLTQMESSEDQAQAQQANAILENILDVRNKVAEIDVDIIIDQSFDVINVQQEQFQVIAQFAQSSQDIDIIELIELSQLRGKDELIEKIETRRQQQAEAAGNIAEMQAKGEELDNYKTAAEIDKTQAEADQKKLENQLILMNPAGTNVSI